MSVCWLRRQLHQLKASTAIDIGTCIFICFFMTGGLGKHGLVDHSASERDLSALLVVMLVLGRRQQSMSILIFLEIDKVRRFD